MSLIEKKFEILNFENDKNPQPKWYAIPVIDFVNALKLWEDDFKAQISKAEKRIEEIRELNIGRKKELDMANDLMEIVKITDIVEFLKAIEEDHNKLFGSVSEWEGKK